MTGRVRRKGFVLRATTDAAYWDRLVSAHPGGTPFHLSAFLTTAAEVLHLQAEFLVAERDGAVVGAVPLLIRRIGPFVLVNHRLPFPYLGPLLFAECTLDEVVAA